MQVKSRICGRRGMWHAWDRREKCARFWWESTKGKDHSEVRAVDGIKVDLREIGWWYGVDSTGSG
jgi:hypothetical protein